MSIKTTNPFPPFVPTVVPGRCETDQWFDETLYADVRQSYKVHRELFRDKSEFQDVIIFENPVYGRVLALDGVIQVAENGEWVYHEMMTHLPIFAHGAVKKVLIIGGGDGGIAREAVKHPLEKVTMVELDRAVVDMTSQYMPRIPQGVFDNPKLELMFMDGCQFVKQTKERYDVIIVDSTDPVGPGAVLFTKEFYTDCCNLLTERGILVTQNGVPFFQGGELTQSVTFFRELMKDGYCYLAPIPSYFGGFMALGWASHDPQNRKQPLSVIEQRVAALNLDLQYYTPEMHVAAFALPGFVKKLLPA